MPRVMIIDALNMFIRNYVINPSLSPNGQPVGGICGSIKSLQKLCKEINPDQIIICHDGEGGSTKRKKMNKEYKAGRKPIHLNRDVRNLTENEELQNKIWQLTRLAEFYNQLPVIQLLYPNIEADDLISYTVRSPIYKDYQKVIVSADKDFIQLIEEKTILFRPIQDEILTVKKVVEDYKIHPNNFALARSITGDTSDNLKGIKGVGMATVAKRFPMLSETTSHRINDIKRYASEQESSLKIYQSVIDEIQIIENNYKIMQLSSPQISLQVKNKINNIIENFIPEMNQTEFKKMSIQDGFAVIDFSGLFSTMKKIMATKDE